MTEVTIIQKLSKSVDQFLYGLCHERVKVSQKSSIVGIWQASRQPFYSYLNTFSPKTQKQSCIDILAKRCSENMQQIYSWTPMRKWVISIKLLFNFIEITLSHGCSPVNLMHIFITPIYKNTSKELFKNAGCKLNVHKKFKISLERFLDVLCKFNLRPIPKVFEDLKCIQSQNF